MINPKKAPDYLVYRGGIKMLITNHTGFFKQGIRIICIGIKGIVMDLWAIVIGCGMILLSILAWIISIPLSRNKDK